MRCDRRECNDANSGAFIYACVCVCLSPRIISAHSPEMGKNQLAQAKHKLAHTQEYAPEAKKVGVDAPDRRKRTDF